MNLDVLFTTIGDVETAIALSLIVAFTASYAALYEWRKTGPGRAVFYSFLGFSLLAAFALATVVWGPTWLSADWVRALGRCLVWAFIVFGSVRLLVSLWLSWLKKRPPLHLPAKERREH